MMNRDIDRRAIFLEDGDRRHFIELIGELLERFDVETHAYCLMDNHYHLALRTPLSNLSATMKWLGSLIAHGSIVGTTEWVPSFKVATRAFLSMRASGYGN